MFMHTSIDTEALLATLAGIKATLESERHTLYDAGKYGDADLNQAAQNALFDFSEALQSYAAGDHNDPDHPFHGTYGLF